MGHILGVLGGLLVGLIILSGAASDLNSAFSKNNIANTQQNLVTLRMQTQQFFSGTNYEGLTNDVAVKAGIVPESFIKGNVLRNAWGGDLELSANAANGMFNIELTNIPQEDCTQLARFQADSWAGVSVNGADIDPSDAVAVTDACGSNNTLTYTAR